jgi:GTP-binding protein HflX
LIGRNGQVEHVIVGDKKQIVIPVLSGTRSTGKRLKGLRCIHTHLGGEGISEDDLMDLLFIRFDLMAIIKVTADGLPERLYPAHLTPNPVNGQNWLFLEPVVPSQQSSTCLELINALENEFARVRSDDRQQEGQDRAILISVSTLPKTVAQDSVDELKELALSDDIVVLETIVQRRKIVSSRYILGKGKLSEIMLKSLLLNANLLIFDQELNASQVNSITKLTELRVIDRTQLILDIFARRALSKEGKLQIEMAQLKYMLPRLESRDDSLSRLTGGIGTRGPGETKLEVDRRRIKDRLAKLANKLKEVSKERHRRRERRRKKDVPVISLIGYTNAGKSTLLNSLTNSDIFAEDKLFATLDPTSRRLKFPEDIEVIITDTVGFIRDLPDELLKAFQATLEELYDADVLVHVVDAQNPRFEDQIAVVEGLISALNLQIPILMVLNKMDRIDAERLAIIQKRYNAVPICALQPETFGEFMRRAHELIVRQWRSPRKKHEELIQ